MKTNRLRLIYLCIISLILVCIACNNVNNSIILPDYLKLNSNSHYLLIYFDDSGCTSCRIKELNSWKYLIKVAKRDSIPIEFVFVFNTDPNNPKISENLNLVNFNYKIYFDPKDELEKINPDFSRDELSDVILINSKGKIKMKGNPIFHKQIWDAYIAITKK